MSFTAALRQLYGTVKLLFRAVMISLAEFQPLSIDYELRSANAITNSSVQINIPHLILLFALLSLIIDIYQG